jgi:hypothetical protein
MSLWRRVAILRSIRISRSEGSQWPADGSDAGRTIRIDSGEMGRHSRPGKGEFPADCSDAKIISEIENVANDPTLEHTAQPRGRIMVEGMRDGVEIRVIINSDGVNTVTGYPTNLPRNSKGT